MMMNPYSFSFPPFRRPSPKYAPPPPKQSGFSNYSGHYEYLPPQSHESNLKNTLESNPNFFQDNEKYFEIFGLKMHFDDLLIIAILFFLYQEEVKDTYLYISLILLLLS